MTFPLLSICTNRMLREKLFFWGDRKIRAACSAMNKGIGSANRSMISRKVERVATKM
jgi:hypothetical protein